MSGWLISEGTPTDYGGRTVKVELAEPGASIVPCSLFVRPSMPPKPPKKRRAKKAAKRSQRTWRTERNARIQARYYAGLTAAQLALEFNVGEQGIYYILRSMGTQMRPKGRRSA